MSEREQEILRELEKVVHEASIEYLGDDAPPEFRAHISGMILAIADAIFAIRDGKSWRGLTDPQEIAGKLLQEVGIGDS